MQRSSSRQKARGSVCPFRSQPAPSARHATKLCSRHCDGSARGHLAGHVNAGEEVQTQVAPLKHTPETGNTAPACHCASVPQKGHTPVSAHSLLILAKRMRWKLLCVFICMSLITSEVTYSHAGCPCRSHLVTSFTRFCV